MIVGCYSLALYCDNDSATYYKDEAGNIVVPHFRPWDYTSETGGGARKKARQAGWTINLTAGTAYCPHCKGKSK